MIDNTNYYNKNQKPRMKTVGSEEMLGNIKNFIITELGIDNNIDIHDEIVIKMLILLYSHRYNKGDLFITETIKNGIDLDFSI